MSMRCPACGTMYPDDAKFCTKDGGRLAPFTSGGEPPVTESPHESGHSEVQPWKQKRADVVDGGLCPGRRGGSSIDHDGEPNQ